MWKIHKISIIETFPLSRIISSVEAGCIICTEGRLALSLNQQSLMLTPKSIFLYPPYASVEVTNINTQFKGFIIEVDYEFVLAAVKSIEWSPNLQFISRFPIAEISDARLNYLTSFIEIIMEKSTSVPTQLSSMALESLMRSISYEILDAYTSKITLPQKGVSVKDSTVLMFQTALKKDCLRHRNVEYYASLLGLNPQYFSTTIKNQTGKTPLYWIAKAVIVEAQHLITDSSLSLKEITFQLNFKSQTFFSRWYKQHTGETPSEFRARTKHNLSN